MKKIPSTENATECDSNRKLVELHKNRNLLNSILPKRAKIIMVKKQKKLLLEIEKTAIMAKDIEFLRKGDMQRWIK